MYTTCLDTSLARHILDTHINDWWLSPQVITVSRISSLICWDNIFVFLKLMLMEFLSLDLHGNCLRSSVKEALILSLYLVLNDNDGGGGTNASVDILLLGC